jgi:hypothetical protein
VAFEGSEREAVLHEAANQLLKVQLCLKAMEPFQNPLWEKLHKDATESAEKLHEAFKKLRQL